MKKVAQRLGRRGIIVLCIALALIIWMVLQSISQAPPYEKVTVARGTITEEVIVTGKTKPLTDVQLAFETAGRIIDVNARVGDEVVRGQVLVTLDSSELAAKRAQAEAAVDAQEAKLQELKRGTREEDITVKRAELKKVEQDLRNYYASIPDLLEEAYTKADDAVRKQTNGLFSGDEELSPHLTFSIYNSQIVTEIENQRVIAGQELTKWKKELALLSPLSSEQVLDSALPLGMSRLVVVRNLLNRIMDGLTAQNSLGASTLTAYKANVTTARTNTNTTLASLNTQAQAIASQKLAVQRTSSELQLKLAGAAVEEIRAQEAQVAQAKAEVRLIDAQLQKLVLTAPLGGVVTTQDATVGEIVAAHTPLVTIISRNSLEIEAHVPEIDVGTLAVQNPVRITVDALPGDSFVGTVLHIDPAETIIDGVVNYKVAVSIDGSDPRIKSGLTVNLAIQTQKKEGVLVVPQYTILETDNGTFVRTLSGTTVVEIPVALGVRSQDGMVEILSGVSEGDEILNVGMKTEGK